jgi:hypothetical protein
MKGRIMPQLWEYCTVTHQGNTAILDFFAAGGSANYRSEAAGRFNMFMTRVGTAGWDLIAVIAGGTYFFKRAIQPGRRIDDAF